MLSYMRKNAGAFWVKGTFIVIIAVFVSWGASAVLRGDKADAVASVNGKPIRAQDVERAHRNMLQAYKTRFGDQLSPELVEMMGLRQRAFDELIRIALMRQEAERLGLDASDDEVRMSISGADTFKVNGRFDPEIYRRILHANNLTPSDFESSQREEILVRKLQDMLLSGVFVSDEEVRRQFAFDNDKVALRFVKVAVADFEPQATVTDDEIAAYFEENKEAYREPERVRIEIAAYRSSAFRDTVTVEDAEIEAYYNDNQSDYEQPEQVRARQILISVPEDADEATKTAQRAKAEAALARARNGEDFAALAKELSDDGPTKDNGGDLGFVPRGRLPQPVDEAVFSTETGQLAGVIESEKGFHILRIDEKQAAGTKPLAEVRNRVADTVRNAKAEDARTARASADLEKMRNGEALSKVIEGSPAQYSQPGPFARQEVIAGVGRVPELVKAVFAEDVGSSGEVEDGKTTYLYRVSEKIDSRIPELSAVRDKVETAAKKKKVNDLARARAREILDAAKQSKDLVAVAAAQSLTVGETEGFSRTDAVMPGLGESAELKTEALTLTSEKPVARDVYEVDDAYVVAVFKERIPADESKLSDQKSNILEQLRERRKMMVLESFTNELKQQAVIETRPDFIASLGSRPAI